MWVEEGDEGENIVVAEGKSREYRNSSDTRVFNRRRGEGTSR